MLKVGDRNENNLVKSLIIEELLNSQITGHCLSRVELKEEGIITPKGKIGNKSIDFHLKRGIHSLIREKVVIEEENMLQLNLRNPGALAKMIDICVAHPMRGRIVERYLNISYLDYFSSDLGDIPFFLRPRFENGGRGLPVSMWRIDKWTDQDDQFMDYWLERADRERGISTEFKLAYLFWAIRNTNILRNPKVFLNEPTSSFISHFWNKYDIISSFREAVENQNGFVGYLGKYRNKLVLERSIEDLTELIYSILKANSLPVKISGRLIKDFFRIPKTTEDFLFTLEMDVDTVYLGAPLGEINRRSVSKSRKKSHRL